MQASSSARTAEISSIGINRPFPKAGSLSDICFLSVELEKLELRLFAGEREWLRQAHSLHQLQALGPGTSSSHKITFSACLVTSATPVALP